VSRFPLYCSVDADSIIEENALLRVVKPFMEHPDEMVAAGGIVRIANGCKVRDGRVVEIGLPKPDAADLPGVEYLRAFLSAASLEHHALADDHLRRLRRTQVRGRRGGRLRPLVADRGPGAGAQAA